MSKVLKIILIFVLAFILVICGVCAFLTITEYKPSEIEPITPEGNVVKTIAAGDELTLLTYNLGSGILSADMDLFSEGGTMVSPQHPSIVNRNLDCMLQIIKNQNCDITLMQEIDEKSSRNHKIDMVSMLKSNLSGISAYAYDYKCKLVPFPITSPTGSVSSGILTSSHFEITEATRNAFATAKKWPFKLFDKKEAFIVTRINLSNAAEQQLVVVNTNFYDGNDSTIRIEQMKQLAAFLTDEYSKGNFVIAGGTFNQTFPNADPAKYPIRNSNNFVPGIIESSLFGSGWSFSYDESTPTARLMSEPYNEYDPYTQYYVVDGFILSPNITLLGSHTVDTEFKYSKHQPVRTRILLGTPIEDNTETEENNQ